MRPGKPSGVPRRAAPASFRAAAPASCPSDAGAASASTRKSHARTQPGPPSRRWEDMTFHPSPSAARRLFRLALIPALVALPGRVLAEPADQSLLLAPLELEPGYGLDPRFELDPHLDPPEPPARPARRPARRLARARRRLRSPSAPSTSSIEPGEQVLGVLMLLSLPLESASPRRRCVRRTSATTRAHRSRARRRPGTPAPAAAAASAPPPTLAGPRAERAASAAARPRGRDARRGARRRGRRAPPRPPRRSRSPRAMRSPLGRASRRRCPSCACVCCAPWTAARGSRPRATIPTRVTAVDAVKYWLEARATWRLDRLVFAEEEVALERMRQERAEAQARLRAHVLKVLFAWQRALALVEDAARAAGGDPRRSPQGDRGGGGARPA